MKASKYCSSTAHEGLAQLNLTPTWLHMQHKKERKNFPIKTVNMQKHHNNTRNKA